MARVSWIAENSDGIQIIPRPEAGRTPPKWSQQWSPKRAQNGPENEPKIEPFGRAQKLQNALFSLCFRLKRAPEGGPKRAQNGAQTWAPEWAKIGHPGAEGAGKISGLWIPVAPS